MGDAAAAAKQAYTLTDLKANTTEKSCYLLIDGRVYNVTEFLDEHPGGEELFAHLTACCRMMLCTAVHATAASSTETRGLRCCGLRSHTLRCAMGNLWLCHRLAVLGADILQCAF